MLIAVAGGKLQGVEAVYLAKKAGFTTLVIDKNPHAPATGLADRILTFEFSPARFIPESCPQPDLIFPAIEDEAALELIIAWAETKKIPIAFDLEAYRLTQSKQLSNRLFADMNLPMPKVLNDSDWPCESAGNWISRWSGILPLVVKPDQSSGSQGVVVIKSAEDLASFNSRQSGSDSLNGLIVQEYIDGPSYSIEVTGKPGQYRTYAVTELEMDDAYDCCAVLAPATLDRAQVLTLETMAVALAENIRLSGIMDLEVILHNNELKLLEIDARIPSQTPMAVFQATGVNMIQSLASHTLDNSPLPSLIKESRCARIEHIHVSGSQISVKGEHIMGQFGPLFLHTDFFGADEALVSFPVKQTLQHREWVATLIFTGISHEAVLAKQSACHAAISNRLWQVT